jgi:hypothetical protein
LATWHALPEFAQEKTLRIIKKQLRSCLAPVETTTTRTEPYVARTFHLEILKGIEESDDDDLPHTVPDGDRCNNVVFESSLVDEVMEEGSEDDMCR